jgi:hypothetical protein
MGVGRLGVHHGNPATIRPVKASCGVYKVCMAKLKVDLHCAIPSLNDCLQPTLKTKVRKIMQHSHCSKAVSNVPSGGGKEGCGWHAKCAGERGKGCGE